MDLVMAQFSDDDLKDVEPSHTLVDGVNWISPKESGDLVFIILKFVQYNFAPTDPRVTETSL